MNPRRAYVVAGPESSGTRYLHRLLLGSGCSKIGDNAGGGVANSRDNLVAVHRSFPWGGKWVRLANVLGELHQHGYRTIVLVAVRDQIVCELSQVANGHVLDVQTARENIKRAYREIWHDLTACAPADYRVVPYQSLREPVLAAALMKSVHLEPGTLVGEKFVDGDAKYAASLT